MYIQEESDDSDLSIFSKWCAWSHSGLYTYWQLISYSAKMHCQLFFFFVLNKNNLTEDEHLWGTQVWNCSLIDKVTHCSIKKVGRAWTHCPLLSGRSPRGSLSCPLDWWAPVWRARHGKVADPWAWSGRCSSPLTDTPSRWRCFPRLRPRWRLSNGSTATGSTCDSASGCSPPAPTEAEADGTESP